MANRIVGNVIIVDSAMGNSSIILDTQITKIHVTAIGFWAANTTATCMFTSTDTANDILFKHDGATVVENPRWFPFGNTQMFSTIKVPVLTAGTAFIYFA